MIEDLRNEVCFAMPCGDSSAARPSRMRGIEWLFPAIHGGNAVHYEGKCHAFAENSGHNPRKECGDYQEMLDFCVIHYIHEREDWPAFCWDEGAFMAKLVAVRHRQGRLLGRMEGFIMPLPYDYWRLKALNKACH